MLLLSVLVLALPWAVFLLALHQSFETGFRCPVLWDCRTCIAGCTVAHQRRCIFQADFFSVELAINA